MNKDENPREEQSFIPREIAKLRDQYRERRESSLLDAVTASISLSTIQYADEVDPQMREAFEIANPRLDLDEYLKSLDFENTHRIQGVMSNWRGKYFEVMVKDRLNSGGHVGDLVLDKGQRAELAQGLNQPEWDLRIVSDSGELVSEIQLKAVKDIRHIREALETYPNTHVLTTVEAAERITDPMVILSGITNENMKAEMTEAVDAVVDSPLVDALEMFGQGLPVILIAGTEGTLWLMGRRTFATAFSSSVNRAVKTGVVMAAGALVAATGAGALSLPTVFATRLVITRHGAFSQLSEQIDADIEQLRMLSVR